MKLAFEGLLKYSHDVAPQDMIYETDLFSFSFVPNWYLQLDALAELALSEPWRFRSGGYSEKNYDTPILERYIQSIFRKQVIDYNAATDKTEQDRIILMRNEYACFHTGLYTKRYKPIYACFGRNKKLDSLLKWCFRGFADENSALLRYISPLPEKPLYSMPLQGIHYVPDWPVRVNVEHILGDPANVARLPTELQSARNLPLLLETAVELARRKAIVSPGDAVPQIYQQRLQYLLPLCLTDKWANELMAYAQESAVNHGKQWLGYKLVESRTNRKYTDEDAVVAAARAAGYTDIFKKSLIPITEMEKLMGKKTFAEVLGSLVIKPKGKPTLVPASDRRPAISTTGAKQDFTVVIHHIIAKDTIDERIMAALHKKEKTQTALIDAVKANLEG